MQSNERIFASISKVTFERKNYFRTCGTVLVDTVANKVYGLEIKRISASAEEESKGSPKFSKATELATKYGYWVGLAEVGEVISRYIGPALGYTLTFAHPFIVSATAKALNDKSMPITKLKPSLPVFLASFGLIDFAVTPLYLGTINRIVHLSNNSVHAALAAGSLLAGTAVSLTIEYLSLRFIWKNLILRGMERGTMKDELKGFFKEFNPLSIFNGFRHKNPTDNASEYFGQIFGIIESVYLWVQLAAVAVALVAVKIHDIRPDDFISEFFLRSAQWGKKFLEAVALAKCCVLAENKIRENQEAMGRDP